MPDHFTARLALPYPDIDDPANVPADMQQLAERLDLLIPAGAGAGLVLNRALVGDVGMAGQVRAGRQLTAADFTNLGLVAPLGLWNLSDVSDVSGNARALTNKGAVTFVPGINGAATTAAQFSGSTGQALYIADTGAADPFRIKTGSWGCWMRTAKRGLQQYVMAKMNTTATDRGFALIVDASNVASAPAAAASLPGGWGQSVAGAPDVADDRWHLLTATFDGSTVRLYIDGTLESTYGMTGSLNGSAGPFNLGGYGADAATATQGAFYGRVDEAFVIADVLTDDQVRYLYCARLPHGYGLVPSGVKVNVTRRRRGGAWAVADFPVTPLRLHNFTAASLADQGSNAQPLTNPAGYAAVAGADGVASAAYHFTGGGGGMLATDAGLPSGTNPRTYGCWFKTASVAASAVIMGWGTSGSGDARLGVSGGPGLLYTVSGGDQINGPYIGDGQWHAAVVVEDNAAVDGLRRKFYVDGRLVGSSNVLTAIVLAGAGKFRVGAHLDGTATFIGQVDGVFVTDVALTTAQVLALWAKGSQALAPSPKNAGDHVEAWDAAAVYATFDSLDSSWQVDMGVAA